MARVTIEMTREEHIARHKELHRMLDELVADFISCTGKMPSKSTVMELMEWSCAQTTDPQAPRG
jgi:hypothetical protein